MIEILLSANVRNNVVNGKGQVRIDATHLTGWLYVCCSFSRLYRRFFCIAINDRDSLPTLSCPYARLQ